MTPSNVLEGQHGSDGLVVAICPNCGEHNPDRARFCMVCATSLQANPAAKQARKTVTVVFSDMANSTALGERLDPESIRALLDRYFSEMRSILERHGGTVEKFIGDAVMAVFGIPVAHEDDALRAVKAAVQLGESVARLNEDLKDRLGITLRFRTGINTGEVIAGDSSRGQSFATGDAVNVAARLQQTASPGEVLMGSATYHLVRDAVLAESVEPMSVKGKADPLQVWRLESIQPSIVPRRLHSSLVGREGELEVLHGALARAQETISCHMVTVLGQAGVGKSRLTEEFLSSLGEAATFLRGRCLPYGEGITFWPIAEIVKQAASLTEDDPPARVEDKIAELVEQDRDSALISRHVMALIGAAPSTATIQESFWSVRKLLESLSRRGPLVVVLDDVHWGEPTFLDLIDYVVGFSKDTALLLVCLARPELLDLRDWGSTQPTATFIRLHPLEKTESERLIDNLLGDADLAQPARQRISGAAQGNPLFVTEMLRMLVDDGALVRQNGLWMATRDLDAISVPPTIDALLAARLDRLTSSERETLQRGATVGQVFWWGSVTAMSPEEAEESIGSYLQALVRKELIRPEESTFSGEDAFGFTHILIRDAAYNAMPRATRAELHERFASWLEDKARDRLSEYEEIIGYHLEQAYRYGENLQAAGNIEVARRAAHFLGRSGQAAQERGDAPAAVNLLSRALSLLPPEDPERIPFSIDLSDELWSRGERLQAADLLQEVAEPAQRRGDKGSSARIALRSLELQSMTDTTIDVETVLDTVERLITDREAHGGDEAALAELWLDLAAYRAWLGYSTAAEEAFNTGLAYAQRAGTYARKHTASIHLRCMAIEDGPTPVDAAIARINQLLEAAIETTRYAGAGPLLSLAYLTAMKGLFEEAWLLLDRGRIILRDLGLVMWDATMGASEAGAVAMLADAPDVAERELRRGFEILEKAGEKGLACSRAAALARALFQQGRFQEALSFAKVSEDMAARDDLEPQLLLRGVRAKVLARQGKLQEAEVVAREAVALAAPTEWINSYADSLMDLADVLLLAAQPEEAIGTAHHALDLYEKKGNIVSAQNARKLLQELASPPSV